IVFRDLVVGGVGIVRGAPRRAATSLAGLLFAGRAVVRRLVRLLLRFLGFSLALAHRLG
ncbi:MAG: hypothetical protein GTO30_05635, partial [Acidobacteria bacterium]|nr:hypothetical protein [Acidobacteriota bacterium]